MSTETVPVPRPDADTIVYLMMDLMEEYGGMQIHTAYGYRPYDIYDAEKHAKYIAHVESAMRHKWLDQGTVIDLNLSCGIEFSI